MTAPAVRSLATFVPAGDRFELCLEFYQAIGFTVAWQAGDYAELRFGAVRFILQRVHWDGASDNFMFDLEVEDLDAWWQHIAALDLTNRFTGSRLRAPETYPWGKREIHLIDPAGILRHIAVPA